MGYPVKHDTLELHFRATTQTVNVRRGTFKLEPGALSYVHYDDPPTVRVYVPLHCVERFRYLDLSDARV